jgi:hypothetical protein
MDEKFHQHTMIHSINQAVKAAREGNVDVLKGWLSSGNDPDAYDDEGWTPLLAASSRGKAEVVDLLLFNDLPGAKHANPNLRFVEADALPIYMAAQAGDLDTIKLLLKADPQQLFAISSVNGHTVLLQAAFFGKQKHWNVAKYLLENIATIFSIPENDEATIAGFRKRLTVATNVRGYNALRMNTELWMNEAMASLFKKYDRSTPEEQKAYLDDLLIRIATPQQLTDRIINTIQESIERVKKISDECDSITSEALNKIKKLLQMPGCNVNWLGGPLQQPPLVFAVTGVDTQQPVAAFRKEITRLLLDHGANPDLPEKHPMGVDAVIRTAVLNNFELLQLVAGYMSPVAFTAAMNTKPAVNGLTALHDSVHRALTAPPDKLPVHLDQIKWMIAHGARYDIEDHTGQTQEQLARSALDDPNFQKNAHATLQALGLSI